MMHESQRLAYLNALGITQYVPLAPIPGAPELPVLQDDFVVEAGAELPDIAVVAEAAAMFDVAPAPEPQVALIPTAKSPTTPGSSDVPVLDVSKVKPDPVVKTTPPKPAATTQRFALAVVTLPQRLRLIVELAQPDVPGFSAREHRLVSDLLLALDASFELNDSATKLFRWPLVNNPRIAADAGAARDALFAFLAGAQEATTVPATVFLGSAALQTVQTAEPGTVFHLADIPGRCIVTHSLREMEQDWRLKPAMWGHMLALCPPTT